MNAGGEGGAIGRGEKRRCIRRMGIIKRAKSLPEVVRREGVKRKGRRKETLRFRSDLKNTKTKKRRARRRKKNLLSGERGS